MAYNNRNKKKEIAYVLSVYNSIKESDIPDTQIVNKKLREKGIFISYSTLMNYKGLKPSDLENNQLSLFSKAS